MHGRNGHRLAQVGSSWEGRPSPWGQDAKAAAFCWAAGSWLLGAAPLSPPLPARALLLPPVLCCTSPGALIQAREGFPSTARLDASIL